MNLILQIAGIIFILLIIFGLIFIFYARRMVKSIQKEALESGQPTPSTIHLQEDDDPAWLAKPAVEEMTEALRVLGFAPDGSYMIPEMDGVKLFGLFHYRERVCAVLYDHPTAGNWADLMARLQDGEEVTVSNAAYGKEIEPPPGAVREYLPNASIAELWQKMTDLVAQRPKIEVSNVNFRKAFEEAYNDEMAWRKQKDGVSRDEIRRVSPDKT